MQDALCEALDARRPAVQADTRYERPGGLRNPRATPLKAKEWTILA